MSDVKKELEEHNINIYFNKVKMDLKNNTEALNRTVSNIIDLNFYNLKNEIKNELKDDEILSSFDFNKYKKMIKTNTKKVLDEREKSIEKLIKSHDKIYDFSNKKNKDLEKISKEFEDNYYEEIKTKIYDNKMKEEVKNHFKNEEVNLILEKRIIKNIIVKVVLEEKLRLQNLYNSFKASYKYIKNINKQMKNVLK